MNVKFGLVLDKPTQFLNKGSNVLFLGDFEYCNAGDRSARIYVSDSNGDITEIEDDVTKELDVLKDKILTVTENLPSEEWKPKLIYLVKSDSGKQTYTPNVIKNMYTYYLNNKDRIKPYYNNVDNLGLEHKILPYLDDRTVFGIIEGSDIKTLIELFKDLTNKFLDNTNSLFTTLYNVIMKYNINFSDAYKEFVNVMDQFNNIIKETVKVYLYVNKIYDETISVNGQLGCPDKVYTTTKFVNGTAERYSTLNFSSKNPNKDQVDEPFVDMIVVALSGTSVYKYCSFRVDKRTSMISNFYGDSTHFYFENSNSLPKLPLNVKNRYTYKIISNWDLNMVDTLAAKVIPTNYVNRFTGVTNDVQLNDLIILSGSTPCKLDLSVDEKGGRILTTRNANTNAELSSIRSEFLSAPSGNYLRLIDGSITAFFQLTETKKRSGLQPIFYNRSTGKTLYLNHVDKYPVYNQVRFSCDCYRPKSNAGTRLVVFYDQNGKEFYRISKSPVFATYSTNVTYNFPSVQYISKIYMERYIDTRSNGWARVMVDIYSEKTGWKRILDNGSYRTGDGWAGITFNVNVKPE